MQNNQTRGQKVGTSWLKILGYVVGGFMLLGVVYFLLLFFVFSSIAEDRQRAENRSSNREEQKSTAFSGPLEKILKEAQSESKKFKEENNTYAGVCDALPDMVKLPNSDIAAKDTIENNADCFSDPSSYALSLGGGRWESDCITNSSEQNEPSGVQAGKVAEDSPVRCAAIGEE